MTDIEALQITLDLAVQNMIDEQDNPEEFKRQDKATDIVADMIEARSVVKE